MYDMTRSRNRSGLEVKSVTLFACVTATVKFIKGAVVMDGSHFPSLVPERHSEFAVAAAFKNAPDTCVTVYLKANKANKRLARTILIDY